LVGVLIVHVTQPWFMAESLRPVGKLGTSQEPHLGSFLNFIVKEIVMKLIYFLDTPCELKALQMGFHLVKACLE
jgi:hypothetical protein